MQISIGAAMLLPIMLAIGGFAGGQAYEAAIAARHARWCRRQR